MLYNDHCKAEKELQRKIDKLKQEGKDPNMPHKPERPVTPLVRGVQLSGIQTPQGSASPPPLRPMIDTVDESFMLLGGQRVRLFWLMFIYSSFNHTKSDPGDAFNQFWTIMQGMLDNLSQPVAFATVPLGMEDTRTQSGMTKSTLHKKDDDDNTDTEIEEPIFARLSRRIGIGLEALKSPSVDTYRTSLSSDDFEDVDELLEKGKICRNVVFIYLKKSIATDDEMSDSFYLVPTDSGLSQAALKRENVQLKTDMESMRQRLETMERAIQLRKEQDMQLRDSIFQATREVGIDDISILTSNIITPTRHNAS